MTATDRRIAGIFAKTSDTELAKALRTLDAITDRTREQRWARARTIEEVERRYPAAAQAVGHAFDTAPLDEPVDYVGVLLTAAGL